MSLESTRGGKCGIKKPVTKAYSILRCRAGITENPETALHAAFTFCAAPPPAFAKLGLVLLGVFPSGVRGGLA